MSDKSIDWRPTRHHWGVVVKSFHWILAILIIGMLIFGHYMHGLPDGQRKFDLYQLHKSIGFTILALVFVRLLWRLTCARTPPLPEKMPFWQKAGAFLSHLGLYTLMVAIPITGWVMVSSSTLEYPTYYFGWFEIPHIAETNGELEEVMESAHSLLGWVLVALLVAHLAAGFKHLIIDRDTVFARIFPGRIAPDGAAADDPVKSPAGGIIFVSVMVLTIGGGAWALFGPAASTFGVPGETPPESGTSGWIVDLERTTLGFTYTQYGQEKTGEFGRFASDITFEPDALDAAKALVTVDITSVQLESGSDTSTAKDTEWLDAEDHPKAVFETTAFRSTGETTYEADAALTIKDRTVDITLPFSLTIDGDTATMQGTVTLDRTAFDVGNSTDVGSDVVVTIDLTATRAR